MVRSVIYSRDKPTNFNPYKTKITSIIFKGKFPKIMTLVGGFIGTLGLLFIFQQISIILNLYSKIE